MNTELQEFLLNRSTAIIVRHWNRLPSGPGYQSLGRLGTALRNLLQKGITADLHSLLPTSTILYHFCLIFFILLQYLHFPICSFSFFHILLKPFWISQGLSPTLCTSSTWLRFSTMCVRSCCCIHLPMKHEVSFLAEHSSIMRCLTLVM